MADTYLSTPPAGLKHTPLSSDANSVHLLLWAGDRSTIKDLMTQLFTTLTQHRAKQSDVVDLEDTETGDAIEAAVQRSVTMAPNSSVHTGGNDGAHTAVSQAQSHAVGPITRLALKDGTNVSDLLKAGFTEPFPVIAPSEEKLVKAIGEWIKTHPFERPPGALVLVKSNLRKPAIEVTLTTSSEPACVYHYKVSNEYMAWFLQLRDGSCMLVKPVNGEGGVWIGYRAWLGGNLDFTNHSVAQKRTARRMKRTEMDDDEVSDDSTDSEEPDSDMSDEENFDPNKPDTSPAVSRTWMSRQRRRNGRRQALAQAQKFREHSNSLSQPQSLQPSQSSRRQYPKRKLRLDIDYNLSSLNPTTPQKPAERKVSPIHRLQSMNLPSSPVLKRERSLSFEMLSVEPAGHAWRPKRSRAEVIPGSIVSSITHLKPKGASTDYPSPTKSAISTSRIPFHGLQSAISVIFHFFLANEDHGAIRKKFSQCNTVDSFFKEAISAWEVLGGQVETRSVPAVKVIIDGASRPIVILWKNREGFELMIEAVNKAVIGRKQDLDVEVKWIGK